MKHKNDQYLVRISDGCTCRIIAHTDHGSNFTTVDVGEGSTFITYDSLDQKLDFEHRGLNISLELWELREMYLAMGALLRHQPGLIEKEVWYKKESSDD